MKPTKNLTVNLTRTLLLILGIVVAVLLTVNSGLIGDASSLLSIFGQSTALVDESQEPDRLEQLKSLVSAGKSIFVELHRLLKTI